MHNLIVNLQSFLPLMFVSCQIGFIFYEIRPNLFFQVRYIALAVFAAIQRTRYFEVFFGSNESLGQKKCEILLVLKTLGWTISNFYIIFKNPKSKEKSLWNCRPKGLIKTVDQKVSLNYIEDDKIALPSLYVYRIFS